MGIKKQIIHVNPVSTRKEMKFGKRMLPVVTTYPDRFKEEYDFYTLWYDAFYSEKQESIIVSALRFFNFSEKLKDFYIYLDATCVAECQLNNMDKCSELHIPLQGQTPAKIYLKDDANNTIFKASIGENHCDIFEGHITVCK